MATLVFFVMHAAPGEPGQIIAGPSMTDAARAQVRANFGLDQPVPVQYLKWMGSFLTGDFGYSYSYSQPVRHVLLGFLPNTLLLGGCALALSFLAGILLGVVQAVRQHGVVDSVLSVVLLFFYSMPSFWLAIMLMLVFSLYARNVWEWWIWFPPSGMLPVDYDLLGPGERLLARIRHLVLPTASLALILTAGVARYMRSGMLEVIRQDYVRTARAKGLPERSVIFKHALRNALLPVVTLLGLYLPLLFSGTVLIEEVFAWPGMGRAVVDAIGQRDYPVVLAGSFLFSVMVVVGNLVADLLYAAVDPRIRYE